MSLREELERVIAMGHNVPTTASVQAYLEATTVFLRDHGQALVEAVEDADRWRAFRHLTSIMDPSFVDSFEHIVPDSDDPEDILKAMNQAIDTARSKTVDGGGV